jgi:hypothetical protein
MDTLGSVDRVFLCRREVLPQVYLPTRANETQKTKSPTYANPLGESVRGIFAFRGTIKKDEIT